MKNITPSIVILCFALLFISCNRNENTPSHEDAVEFAQNTIIVDGHVDLPTYLVHAPEANAVENTANFSYHKAQEGGLNAPFMSIYIPSRYQETGGAKEYADSLISIVNGIANENPDKFAIATSPEEIKTQFEEGLISLTMGMENGAPIGNNLGRIQYYYDKGIRYITLTHGTDNLISDSSYDSTHTHGGLSEFGRQVVREMNNVGIMVDVSHISDEAFYDVMEITQAPVIASHSSARYFTPGWQRNMNDAMIQELAENGGVIMISFGSNFIKSSAQNSGDQIDAHLDEYFENNPEAHADEEAYREEYFVQNYDFATVQEVADHIDHVVNLVGINHVGFGSDFDGVGNTLPRELSDVSELPNLIFELMKRGYTKAELRKICYQNVFRVWNKVQEVAKTLNDDTVEAHVR